VLGIQISEAICLLSCLIILSDEFVYIMPDGTQKSSLKVQIRRSHKMDDQEMISEGFVVVFFSVHRIMG
jgi:hypothetical protein